MDQLIQTPEVVLFIISSLIGFAAWLIRLESKVQYQAKEIEALQKKSGEIETMVMKDLNEVKVNLAEIKGYLFRKSTHPQLDGIHLP